MLSHIFSLGITYAKPPVAPQPKDSFLLTFPNYVTGFLIGVECAYAAREQVQLLLQLAYAERYYKSPPPQVSSEQMTAQMLYVSLSTLRSWVTKGWIYRWRGSAYEYVFSHVEVQTLRLAQPRSL